MDLLVLSKTILPTLMGGVMGSILGLLMCMGMYTLKPMYILGTLGASLACFYSYQHILNGLPL